MFSIYLNKYVFNNTDTLEIILNNAIIGNFTSIQIEIIKVGQLNNSFKLSTQKEVNTNVVFDIGLNSFENGYYEVKKVIYSNAHDNTKQILLSEENYDRLIFQVTDNQNLSSSKMDVLHRLKILETITNELFYRPIKLTNNVNNKQYSAFIFIENLLIKTYMKIDKFEIIPIDKKLSLNHYNKYVEDFLNEKFSLVLKSGLTNFSTTPVCVIHFPAISSDDPEKIKNYCLEKMELIIQLLSLTRESGGKFFNLILLEKNTNRVLSYGVQNSYKGNLLGGIISGENPEKLASYYEKLKDNPILSFLVHLYKEAKNEYSRDFQYLRLWQILETLAESKNYSKKDDLFDMDMNPIMNNDSTKQMKISGSTAIVYNLIKILKTVTWEDVNIWFAFRNAVGHYGSISYYTELDREYLKNYASKAIQDMEKSGYDNYIMKLDQTTKNILIKELQN